MIIPSPDQKNLAEIQKPLASSSLFNPSMGFNPYNPQASTENRSFITVFVNGEKRVLPALTNQVVNRRLFKPSLSTLETALPKKGESVILPYLTARKILEEKRSVTPIQPPSSSPTFPLPSTSPAVPLPETKPTFDPLTQTIIKETLEEKSTGPADTTLSSYKEQIGNLVERGQELNQQILQAQQELQILKQALLGFQTAPPQSTEESTKKAEELKQSIILANQKIKDLESKIGQKQKLLEDFLQQSQNETETLAQLAIQQKSSEALIANLKNALQNAQNELKNRREKGAALGDIKSQEEQIRVLSEKLKIGEAEKEQWQKDQQRNRATEDEINKLKTEIEGFQKDAKFLNEKKVLLTQVLTKAEEENKKLKEALEQLQKENAEKGEKLLSQEKSLEQLTLEKERIIKFAQELAQKLTELKSQKRLEQVIRETPTPESRPKPETETKIIRLTKDFKSNLSPLTKLPNAISGIVKNKNNELLADIVVIIKDTNNHPVRALNTNALGQFMVTSSLASGVYQVQVVKEGLTFDIIELELTGSVVSPIEIVGR